MLTSRGPIRSLLLAALLGGCLLAVCAPAGATPPPAPAQVSVRVLGQAPGFATILPLTTVTTTSAPLVKDGGSCSGTSAAGALELATRGGWEGHWNAGFGDYEVLSIKGQEYPFDPSSNHNYYWSFWLNGAEATTGICGAQLSAGDQLLFFPGCFGSECPPPPNVLGVQAQEAAEVGSPVALTVVSHPSAGGQATPLAGATVSSSEGSAKTDASGHATLSFAHAGVYAVHVSGPGGTEAVPAEASVCVHAGNDGTCGTTASSQGVLSSSTVATQQSATSLSGAPYRGPFALVAHSRGPVDGRVYSRRSAPRLLIGTVESHSPVASVALRLRRRNRGRCSSYDGRRERFLAAPCGSGAFFNASTSDAFSYLLPAPLAPGRYVLDIRATDAAGNRTVAARGTSRIVFYVR